VTLLEIAASLYLSIGILLMLIGMVVDTKVNQYTPLLTYLLVWFLWGPITLYMIGLMMAGKDRRL